MTTTTVDVTRGSVAWARRRAALAGFWRQYRRDREGLTGLILLVLIAAVAVAAPLLAAETGLSVTHAPGRPIEPPSGTFWMGTDFNGRPIMTLIIWGSRISLIVGFAATVISMVIGTLVGVLAGHFTGWRGGVFNKLTDWFLVIPFLPLAIALAQLFHGLPKLLAVIIVIGITSWSGTARLVRAQALTVEARPYLERAKALGAGHWHQVSHHVLPNVMPLVLANTTLTVSISILAETTLSFLGLGDPLHASWGTVLHDAYAQAAISNGAWWWVIFPGLSVVVVVRAFNMCGRATERILDPRLRERA
ncbi:ABC transporter permease [Catellatospora paridis]|uniref:ABC transporter permease n=1 Tax=Catellatospora paridis TaxID=1617086 RepID=UPI0012D3DF51|nr:ABC transporter permease [Catellatospora paridis]